MSDNSTTLALAAGMGLIAGMRSMSAPALLSHRLSRRKRRGRGAAARLLASRRAAGVLGFLAAGEMAADKAPFVPARTEPPSLAGRAFMAALSGAAIAGWRGGSRLGAALAGSAAAVCAAFAAYHLRRAAGMSSGVPDPVLGLLEDAVVLTAGARLADAVA